MHASELLSERRFWRLIEASLEHTESVGLSRDRQGDSLVKQLEKLSRSELIGYAYCAEKFFTRAYKQELWAVSYIVMGGCGDDCFMDFRWWLLTRGNRVYRAALRNHESLRDEFDKIPDGDIPLWGDAMGLAKSVFEARYGQDSYDAEEQRFEFDRTTELERLELEWDSSDTDSLERLCPETYAKWWDNTRF